MVSLHLHPDVYFQVLLFTPEPSTCPSKLPSSPFSPTLLLIVYHIEITAPSLSLVSYIADYIFGSLFLTPLLYMPWLCLLISFGIVILFFSSYEVEVEYDTIVV